MGVIINAAFLVTILVTTTRATSYTFLNLGMDMSVRAYDAVCWYDNLVQFPNTNSNSFLSCQGQGLNVQNQVISDTEAEESFGQWMIDNAMVELDSVYSSKCDDYLLNHNKTFTVDQSDILNDGKKGAYPFQGFSFCMLTTLGKKHGEKALQAVRNEMTVKKKNWRDTILDRDNAFRSLHGVLPLNQNDELDKVAQKWADTMASECNLVHSYENEKGRKFQGESTGESIASGVGDIGKSVAAYIASDSWYEEIKDYPYPKGFKKGDKDLLKKTGHFTQTIWKGSTEVGYGFAYNLDCYKNNWYMAARYFPAGNGDGDGEYQNNVFPPLDSNNFL